MVDQMQLQQAAQYQYGKYVGVIDRDLFKGRLVFMIEVLIESVLYVIKAIPEVQYSGQFLATETAECINSLWASGFNGRSVVNGNHFENVNSFKCLHTNFQRDLNLYVQYPRNGYSNIYFIHVTRDNFSKIFVTIH